jgi:transcriptional regulator with XRE-family HTH domain
MTQTLGQRIREARTKRGLTQSALAQAIGAREAQVCNWERDKHKPAAETVASLAEALDKSSDWLLGREQGTAEPATAEG